MLMLTGWKIWEVEPQLYPLKSVSSYGYIDQSGDWVIKPQFEYAGGFSDNGLARVKVNGKWGYIDQAGDWVIKPQFDWADSFSDNGLASVEFNGKYGYIDQSGD
jgi:hypothetical protein